MSKSAPLIYENVFSKSPEQTITAQKRQTGMGALLWDEGRTTRMEGKTVFVGTKLRVEADLYEVIDGMRLISGKTIKIYHRLDTGAWEVIFNGTENAPDLGGGWYKVFYTLAKAGVHTFYAEFLGDEEYAGCKKAVRAFAKCRVC